MGSGSWSTDVYDAADRYRAATGSERLRLQRRGRAHRAPRARPAGRRRRESRDSDEHPASLAIAVLFDVTGSMRTVPRVLQTKLPQLLGLLLRKGYASDPQILFGAIGDATCDRVPLQVGQFESDNRMDDDLGRIVLEGGGGGQMTESYELAMYFMARHTAIDCYEKRGRRGYLFIIGDELAYPQVKARRGGAASSATTSREDMPLRQIVAELTRRIRRLLHPAGRRHYAGNAEVLDFWRDLLGQNVIELDDLDAVCETIALTVGLGEEAIDLDEGLRDLAEVGSGAAGTVAQGAGPPRRRRRAGRRRSRAPTRARRGRRRRRPARRPAASRSGGERTSWWWTSATATPARARSWTGSAPPGRCTPWSASTGARRPRTTSCCRRAAPHVRPVRRRHVLPGVRTHLSRFMVVDPLALAAEADHLALGRRARRARPADRRPRGAARHAVPPRRQPGRARSPGAPTGTARAAWASARPSRTRLAHPDDAPRVGDCADPALLRRKLTACCGTG